MSADRPIDDYLADIIEAISDISSFIAGLDYEGFAADKKTVNAVIRSLEVIGEAVKKIPTGLRQKHNDLPWKEIAGTRDKLIHEYFGVDLQILWETAKSDLVPLEKAIRSLQEDISS
jgi:uncharacterized protein with HEPN domain